MSSLATKDTTEEGAFRLLQWYLHLLAARRMQHRTCIMACCFACTAGGIAGGYKFHANGHAKSSTFPAGAIWRRPAPELIKTKDRGLLMLLQPPSHLPRGIWPWRQGIRRMQADAMPLQAPQHAHEPPFTAVDAAWNDLLSHYRSRVERVIRRVKWHAWCEYAH